MTSTTSSSNKVRVIVGVLGSLLLVFIMFKLPAVVLASLCLLASWIAWLEWLAIHKQLPKRGAPFPHYLDLDQLVNANQYWIRWCVLVTGITYLSFSSLLKQASGDYHLQQILLMCVIFALLILIRKIRPELGHEKFYLPNLVHLVGGLFYISFIFLYFQTIIDLDQTALLGASHYPWSTFKLLFLVWGSDSAAYISGYMWGSRSLSRHLSPKKTVEGLIGTLVWTTVLFPILFWDPTHHFLWNVFLLCLLGLLTGGLATLGDLFASAIKRGYGIKDFGGIIPGHGGILDRMDSLLFVSPFYALLLKFHVIIG